MTRCLAAWAILLAVAAAGEPAGKYHQNERWGYKVRTPSGWITVALSADEEWIASKHIAKRELEASKTIWWASARPEMWVIGFPHARKEDRAARRAKEKDKSKWSFSNPYADYKDFLKREKWYVGGGYFFSEEKEDTVAGMKVTKYEIKVDKLVAAPFRMVTWVFHFDDIDFAVQFKVFEDYYRRYRQTFRTCLKSFRRIDRTKALPGSATTGTKKVFEEEDESKLTPEERKKRRREKVEQQYRREIDALPKRWYHFETDHYLVLANADKRYTKNLVRHAEAVRAYLDATFGTLGTEYVPPAIIRVFKTDAERSAYSMGTRRFWGSASQVLVVEGYDPTFLNWELTDQWLDFKDRDLSWNMPQWISDGLRQHMSFARSKGRKVRFAFDAWDKDQLRTLLRNKEAVPLKDLISGASEKQGSISLDFDEIFKSSRQSTQAGSVVTYLLTRGNRGKTKGALAKYLGELVVAIREASKEYKETVDELSKQANEEAKAKKESEADDEGEGNNGGYDESEDQADDESGDETDVDTDEEEQDAKDEAAAKERAEIHSEARKRKRRTIRERAFKAAFGHLSDKDWRRLDTSWRRFVD
jgi:hypothetical protein